MADENFLNRWSRLKHAAKDEEPSPTESAESVEEQTPAEPPRELTDDDMPPLETLGFNSDYSGFFSPKVSSELRTAALRKLFRQPEFNVIDTMDDYCEDFTTFVPLGNTLTTELKRRMQREARQQLESLMETHDKTLETLMNARQQALASLQQHPEAVTGQVGYQSHGRLLIIGGAKALEIAAGLPNALKPHVLLTDDGENVPANMQNIITPLTGREISISGHLGAFKLALTRRYPPPHPNLPPQGGKEQESTPHTGTSLPSPLAGEGPGMGGNSALTADLILDLQPSPSLQHGILPPGYYAPKPEQLAATLAELPDMIGEFSKPRYFHYNPSICAHGSSGLKGCNRCIDACPAEAIISVGEKIEVNPNLCQGGGACASACPSGAIRYQYPSPAHSVDQLRVMLRTYREAGGIQPKVLFHRAEMDVPLDTVPATILPFPVEELGSTSPELWFATLSFGAAQVLLYDEDATPELTRSVLQAQLAIAHAQLQGLGYAADAIRLLPVGTPADAISPEPVMPAFTPATQGGMNDKRQQWMVALDHLYQHAPQPKAEIPLPTASPFGLLDIDRNACTLCMACATICPLKAIEGGIDRPQMRFHASCCVQCGLCATGCPEKAITLQPLYIADPAQRRTLRILHEEKPFCCIRCGKPFGSKSAIANMLGKLANHPMFQDERARKRLEMCEDCRVMDVVQDREAMGDTMSGSFRH